MMLYVILPPLNTNDFLAVPLSHLGVSTLAQLNNSVVHPSLLHPQITILKSTLA